MAAITFATRAGQPLSDDEKRFLVELARAMQAADRGAKASP